MVILMRVDYEVGNLKTTRLLTFSKLQRSGDYDALRRLHHYLWLKCDKGNNDREGDTVVDKERLDRVAGICTVHQLSG